MFKIIAVVIFFISVITSYGNTSEDNSLDQKDFFATVSGGWGSVSETPHNTGVVTATLGYFLQENISAEFRYLGYFANQKETKLDGNSYLGLVKYNYSFFNNNLKAGAGVGLGIGNVFKKNIDGAKSNYSGLIALPISIATPSRIIKNMDFIVTYLYVRSFDKGYANFITSGISYSF
ncbi:hypothetical protein FLM55_00945 [Francisella sp. Scap27]|uniref:hypothetical protein n=1 Tax=Francisella sp. Scap27 TaxID=2589986 RepID=UPI0015BCF08A|nr:hypothetical protein [Francisella sp. Scap27]QLE78379.1 hypothetical protein FLM55_00945 [Francisella sp. Scap27]